MKGIITMKKIYLLFTLLTSTMCAPIKALSLRDVVAVPVSVCGISATALAYTLYKDASNNLAKEFCNSVAAEVTGRSLIQEIRLRYQTLLCNTISLRYIKNIFEIEKATYFTCGVLGALISIWGVKTLLSTTK